jgi:hypothetical protein
METARLVATLVAFDNKLSEEMVGSPKEITKLGLFNVVNAIEE